jgi:nitrogenase-stabilizing/protective protein
MNTIAKLKTLSAAEEFFDFLEVPYDPERLRVVRLHVLKQMGAWLEADRLSDIPDEQALAECRQLLRSAYGDFVSNSPLDRRLFKVLKEAVAPPVRPGFVPLSALKEG